MPFAAETWLLPVQAAATWFLTGLIWFVQAVHYPLFDGVGPTGFAAFHARHTRATTWVVAPPMIVEAACAAAIVAWTPAGIAGWEAWSGLALVATIWVSTAWLQVPQHRRLGRGFEGRAHTRLVATNWLRVVAWTARAVLVAYWLASTT